MKKYDVYYASGWFSPEQEKNYAILTQVLKNEGLTLFEPRYMAGEVQDGPLTEERAAKIFKADIDGIDQSKVLFVDASFLDSGCLVEIGYAYGKKVPIVLFDNSTRPKINIMLAMAAEHCLRDLDDIRAWLNGEKVRNIGGKQYE